MIGKLRKAQAIGEVLKYGLVAIFSIFIIIGGYKMIDLLQERACRTEISKFEIDLKSIGQSLRYGTRELKNYPVPCKINQVYILDLTKNIDPGNFNDTPIIKDSIKTKGDNNVFLVKNGEIKHLFYAGNFDIEEPYYMCLATKFEMVSFFVENAGRSIKVANAPGQPLCK